MDYLIATLIFASIYGIIALGLNIQWGLTGLINLGQVAYFAIGAYTTALLSTSGWPFLFAVAMGALASCIFGALVALVTPRLRDDYLAIVTLGFSEFVRLIFLNEKWIAGGPDGIAGIVRPPTLPGMGTEASFLTYALIALLAVYGLSRRLETFPLGRLLRAIREDETVVASVGKRPLAFKAQAFAAGALLAGLAGGFFAGYLTYVSPDMFGPNVSIYVLAAVLIGTQGSSTSALFGTLIVTTLLEGTRLMKDFIPLFDGVQLAALRLILLGIGLMVIVVMRYGPRTR